MIDVYGYLLKMRRARQELMETLDQYKFVYDTLEEYAVCGFTYFPVSEISTRIKQKSVKNPFTKLNDYQHEYSIICKQAPKFSIGDCAGGELILHAFIIIQIYDFEIIPKGHRIDNREKNR